MLSPHTDTTVAAGLAWTSVELIAYVMIRPYFMQLLNANPKLAGQQKKKERTASLMQTRVVSFLHNVVQVRACLTASSQCSLRYTARRQLSAMLGFSQTTEPAVGLILSCNRKNPVYAELAADLGGSCDCTLISLPATRTCAKTQQLLRAIPWHTLSTLCCRVHVLSAPWIPQQHAGAAVQIPLACLILLDPVYSKSPIFAHTDLSTIFMTISAGYFLYDIFECIVRQEGADFVVHGVCGFLACAIAVYSDCMHYFGEAVGCSDYSTCRAILVDPVTILRIAVAAGLPGEAVQEAALNIYLHVCELLAGQHIIGCILRAVFCHLWRGGRHPMLAVTVTATGGCSMCSQWDCQSLPCRLSSAPLCHSV